MILPVKVEYVSEYKANVSFSNGEAGIVDFNFLLSERKVYEKLKNKALFKTIRISEDGMCIEWANGIDVCPDETYTEYRKQNSK